MLMDSLLYEMNRDVWEEAEQLALTYAQECSKLSNKEMADHRPEMTRLYRMLMHLRIFGRVPEKTEVESMLQKLTDSQGWKVKH